MARYSYLTIIVAICRDFNRDRHMDVVVPGNPVKTLCNLVVRGKAVVEIEVVFGKKNMDNYMSPVAVDGRIKYRSCYVVKRFYLKLPYPMTGREVARYVEEITDMELPVYSNRKCMFLSRIYERLAKK